MTSHGYDRCVTEFTLIREFKRVLAKKTARALAASYRPHTLQGNRLVKKLDLSLPAGQFGMLHGEFVSPRAGPPQANQHGGYGEHHQIKYSVSGHDFIRTQLTSWNLL